MYDPIITIIDDLSRMTAFLKTESVCTQNCIYQEAQFVSSHINPILHRLLSLSPSSTTKIGTNITNDYNDFNALGGPAVLQEAARLAAILYLAEIRRNFGILPVTSIIQLDKLQALLARSSSHFSLHHPPNAITQPSTYPWTHFPALYLWILAMGVAESRDDSQRAWFGERLYEAAMVATAEGVSSTGREVGMGAGEEDRGGVAMEIVEEAVERVLKRFLWIDDLHGAMFWRNLLPRGHVALEGV